MTRTALTDRIVRPLIGTDRITTTSAERHAHI